MVQYPPRRCRIALIETPQNQSTGSRIGGLPWILYRIIEFSSSALVSVLLLLHFPVLMSYRSCRPADCPGAEACMHSRTRYNPLFCTVGQWNSTDECILQENIPCTVFEQDPSPTARPRDWNYGVYWAQSGLSECLPPELLDQLVACQVDHHTPAASDILPGFNGKTGERLVDVPAPYSLRLKRRKFLQLISTDLDIQVCLPLNPSPRSIDR